MGIVTLSKEAEKSMGIDSDYDKAFEEFLTDHFSENPDERPADEEGFLEEGFIGGFLAAKRILAKQLRAELGGEIIPYENR